MIIFKTIQLERGQCYGFCPVYKMTIHSDGRVKYFGKHFVDKTGQHQWRIGEDRIDEFNFLLLQFNFYQYKFEPKYAPRTCNPLVITRVEFTTGFKKTIEHDHGHGDEGKKLAEFEDKIDFLSDNKEYIQFKNY